jgi:7-cyano-7-deazaguanine reductase
VTNRILDDLVSATKPRYLRLEARFNVRGGHLHQRDRGAPKKGWRGESASRKA